jgi:hypothetical protein
MRFLNDLMRTETQREPIHMSESLACAAIAMQDEIITQTLHSNAT